jgi:hypothetical protein
MLFLGLRRFSDAALELAETGGMALDQGRNSMDRFGFIGLKASLHRSSQSVYSHKDMNAGNGSFTWVHPDSAPVAGDCTRSGARDVPRPAARSTGLGRAKQLWHLLLRAGTSRAPGAVSEYTPFTRLCDFRFDFT